MNHRQRYSLISNTAYVPPQTSGERIRAEIIRDWRTAKTIARQFVHALPGETWFLLAAVVAGAIVGGLTL